MHVEGRFESMIMFTITRNKRYFVSEIPTTAYVYNIYDFGIEEDQFHNSPDNHDYYGHRAFHPDCYTLNEKYTIEYLPYLHRKLLVIYPKNELETISINGSTDLNVRQLLLKILNTVFNITYPNID